MRTAHPLSIGLLLAALTGCPTPSADDDDTTAAPDDDDDATADDDDSAVGDDDDSALPPEPLGQVTAVWWAEDALFDWPDLTLHAVLTDSEELLGAEDAVGRMAVSGVEVFAPDGYWGLPAPGTQAAFLDEDQPIDPSTVTTWDAGDWVTAGDVLVAGHAGLVQESDGVHVYEQALEEGADAAALQAPGEALDVSWPGGADLDELLLPSALRLPTVPTLLTVDRDHPLPLRAGEDLVLEWTPDDPTTSVVIAALGPDGGVVAHVPDEQGTFTLPWEELAPLGDADISVARLARDDVATGQGVLTVQGIARQFLYGERVGAWAVDAPVWPVGTTLPVQVAWFDGELGASASLDAGHGVTFSPPLAVDTQGDRVATDVTIDAGAATGPRTLSVLGDGGSFEATEAGWVVAELPHAGLCEDAVDEGDVLDGAYLSSDVGLTDTPFDTSECVDTPTGRDQSMPLSLAAGERVRARLLHSGYRGTLYLVSDCADSAPAYPCVSAPAQGPETELTYVALSDEDLLLVADSQMSPDAVPSDFVLDVRRDGPYPFSFEETFFTDGPQTATVWSTQGDWTQGDLSFDLGPDIVVSQVTVPGGTGDVAEIAFDVSAVAARGLRSVSVTSSTLGTVAMPEAIDIGAFLYTPSCAAADVPNGAGSYTGTTAFAAYGEVSGETCLPSTAGGEALVRVDLGPGETLSATLLTDGWDGVLYVVASCEPSAFALACTDQAVSGDAEYLDWPGSAAGGPVWLVVDGVDVTDEGSFDLILDVRP